VVLQIWQLKKVVVVAGPEQKYGALPLLPVVRIFGVRLDAVRIFIRVRFRIARCG
jgi:hypothetical protein